MKLTRELVQEAISLGYQNLPQFSAIELALVLGVPVKAVLKCIQANKKVFKMDAEKTIIGLDASNALQTMNSNEVWNWYLTNCLGGDAKQCLPLSDQNRLNGTVSNSRVKWEIQFVHVAATFASNDKTGEDVKERVRQDYSEAISSRLVRLGTIGGQGQIPDRFLFGVQVTDEELKARKLAGRHLYSPDWAMEAMLTHIDWVTIDVGPKPGAEWIAKDEMTRGLPVPDGLGLSEEALAREKAQDDANLGRTQEQLNESAIAASLSMGKTPIIPVPAETDTGKKINRRTKEQLNAERDRMYADLRAHGVEEETAAKVKALDKFTEAEAHYKSVVAEFSGAAAPPVANPDQQELPGTAEARQAPQVDTSKPMVIAPAETHARTSMPTLANLETVSDIKADIRAKAGGVQPQVVAPVAVAPAAQAVAMAPSIPLAAPPIAVAPVAAPVASGASVSAEDLLNSLLKQTGQG